MRLWLAAAILLALFALVVALQRRGSLEPAPREPAPALPPGWGSVVLGAPSGAQAPVPDLPAPAPAPAPEPVPQPPAAREFELTVSPGQTLSAICKEHYGTASVALVEALARFNRLASADSVRAGQKLRLPPLETLQKP